MTSGVHREIRIATGGIVLGVILAGPFIYSTLAVYSFFTDISPLLITPLVGALVYLWIDDIREGLILLFLMALVSGATLVIALSIPTFVLETSVGGRSAIFQSAISTTLLRLIPAFPIIIITATIVAILDSETNLLPSFPHRRFGRRFFAVTLVLLLVSGGLAASVTVNYASAVDQFQADVEVVGVDASGEQVKVAVRIPNRMTSQLYVRSIVLDINVDEDLIRASTIPRYRIPPRETAILVVRIDQATLTPEKYRSATSIRISGVVRVAAFRNYETTLEVKSYES